VKEVGECSRWGSWGKKQVYERERGGKRGHLLVFRGIVWPQACSRGGVGTMHGSLLGGGKGAVRGSFNQYLGGIGGEH